MPDWPRGQEFGLGLELLASAWSFWPRLTSLHCRLTILGELGHRKAPALSTELQLCCVVCVKLSSVKETGE